MKNALITTIKFVGFFALFCGFSGIAESYGNIGQMRLSALFIIVGAVSMLISYEMEIRKIEKNNRSNRTTGIVSSCRGTRR